MSNQLKNFAKLLSPPHFEFETYEYYEEAPQITFCNKDSGVSLKCFVKCRDEDCRWRSMIDSIDQIYPVLVGVIPREKLQSSRDDGKFLLLNDKRYTFKYFSWYCANCYNKNTESFTIPDNDNKKYLADSDFDDDDDHYTKLHDPKSNGNTRSHENTQPQEDTVYQRKCRMVIKKVVRCKSFKKKSTHPYKAICERLHGIERSLDTGLNVSIDSGVSVSIEKDDE
jgi:hypothetical protein